MVYCLNNRLRMNLMESVREAILNLLLSLARVSQLAETHIRSILKVAC